MDGGIPTISAMLVFWDFLVIHPSVDNKTRLIFSDCSI
jgi:hypothetical protein